MSNSIRGNLENEGITIKVNARCRRAAKTEDGIMASADCNGKGAFTHTSYSDFGIVDANFFDNDHRRVTGSRPMPYTLIRHWGGAGMTEDQARKTARRLLVGQRQMTRLGRAVEKGETQGFRNVIVDADTSENLGAAVLGTGGDEVIHSILAVMYARQPFTLIQRAMHIQPTVSELIPTMLGELAPPAGLTGEA